MSINDILTESVHSYIADDIDVLTPGIGASIFKDRGVLELDTVFKFEAGTKSVMMGRR
jgi:hypothetical protein